ncbi:inactive peptidyl-prolyl cis-trans isomerase FKBP6-like [Penaeus chinensis]|uniref:inactive peptidyl-prolyl cis-trans isomerase FKBP6-like n=1 Tax=Penaeus chinensis TaxID=139456 RepID=UPI001FB5AE8F|nr:inactive peptidyl-prolyl cis-trans isomerase FKBP6-like [Penaeus chinensis]XP_047472263.1 inactive peptidyl-prolyl cis-trans isomerase FKBP6-like [Penaeus chinensis]XP_047472271.1 inactive peptidyl-prolyl cis-trans isomerase FKBP6-like [Penaeus chinensis]
MASSEPKDTKKRTMKNDRYESFVPSVQLTKGLDVREICSETGASFEISEEQLMDEEKVDWRENFFDDEELVKSLRLGAGNGIFEDEESASEEEGEPFRKLARRMEDMTGDGGVLKMIVQPGIGGDIPDNATIIFHYSAFLEYLDEPFDSSYLRKKPEKNKIDSGNIIPGLNVAIKTMRKRETARFLIRPEYGYGKLGCPPRIPGNETLLYEVYIVNVIDDAAADAYDELDEKMQTNMTFEQRLEAARGFHRKGNNHFKEGYLRAAKDCYLRAAWIMEDARLKNEAEEQQRTSLLMKMRCNLAQVYLDLKEPARACTQCKLGFEVAATGLCSEDVMAKLYFRSGKAKVMLSNFKGAHKDLLAAQRIKPNNPSISAELEELYLKQEKSEAQERFMCQRMFAPQSCSSDKHDGMRNAKQEEEKDEETKGKEIEKDLNQNVAFTVRPEFEALVEENIRNFVDNHKIRELPFPSSLSQEEVVCVATIAKAAGLSVMFSQNSADCSLKIVKKL